MEINISEQMRLVLLKAVQYALRRGANIQADDGFGYEIDLNDAEALLENLT